MSVYACRFLVVDVVLLLDFDLLTSSNQLERQIRITQI
jgi:predicted glycosyltransferase involved in capsule biosynthesis